jgi:hypothetical protein
MVKRKIKVNVDEANLIKTLNEKIKNIKNEDKLLEEANTIKLTEKNIEPDSEPETVSTGKKVFVYDDVEPEFVSNTEPESDEPDWKRWECIESDLQRQLKFNSYKDKGHASAYPDTHDTNEIEEFIHKNSETIKEINNRISEVEKPFQPQCGSSNGKLMPEYTFDTETGFSYGIEEKILQCLLNIKKAQKDTIEPNTDKMVDTYEMVDHPQHYNNYEYEVIDMMRKIYGDEKTAIFCELNAFKYRMRMGTKPTSPINEDLKKEQWYLKKKKEILNN